MFRTKTCIFNVDFDKCHCRDQRTTCPLSQKYSGGAGVKTLGLVELTFYVWVEPDGGPGKKQDYIERNYFVMNKERRKSY